MAEGIVTPEQMSMDAKTQRMVSRVFDLSTAVAAELLLLDRVRDLAIVAIDLVYVTEMAAAASQVDIGAGATTNNIVLAYNTSATAAATDANNASLPLRTTLRQAGRWPALDSPILRANTRMTWTNSASGGAGQVQIVVKYYPLSRQTTNA